MTDQERRRILEEARRNIDPERREAERKELAERLMDLPPEDPVAKWRSEMEAAKAIREAAEIAAAKILSWDEVDARIQAAVQAALADERKFLMTVRAVLREVQKTIGSLVRAESSSRSIDDIITRTKMN